MAPRKKKNPFGGNLVPVGGETVARPVRPDGSLGAGSKPTEYVVQNWDKGGKATYSGTAFTVYDDRIQNWNPQIYVPQRYSYGGTPEQTIQESGYKTFGKKYESKIAEANAARKAGLSDSLWSSFTESVQGFAPTRWAWDAFTGVTGAAMDAAEAYNTHVQNPMDHFVASASTALNPDSEGFMDWGKSWEGTFGLDAMQAVSRNPLNPISMAGTVAGTGMGGAPTITNRLLSGGELGDVDESAGDNSELTPEQRADAQKDIDEHNFNAGYGMDPALQEDHDRIREWSQNSNPGRFTTLANSVGYAVVGDPTVLVGKAAKVGKSAVLGRDLINTLGKDGFAKLVDTAADSSLKKSAGVTDDLGSVFRSDAAADSVGDFSRSLDDTLTGKAAKRAAKRDRKAMGRVESMRRNIDWFVEQDNLKVISQHSLVKSSLFKEGYADLLAKANSADEVAMILKAGVGDAKTMDTLRETRTVLAATIENLRAHEEYLGSWREGRFSKVKPTNDATDKWGKFESLDDEKAYVSKFLTDLRKEDDFFAAITGTEDGPTGVFGGLIANGPMSKGGVSAFAGIEAYKLKAAARKGEAAFDVQTIQGNPFATPVRVIRWAGRQRPSNWVQWSGVSDIKSFGDEVTSWLNSAPILKKDPAAKHAYYGRLLSAANRGDAFIQQELKDIELEIMHKYIRGPVGAKKIAKPDVDDYSRLKALGEEPRARENGTVPGLHEQIMQSDVEQLESVSRMSQAGRAAGVDVPSLSDSLHGGWGGKAKSGGGTNKGMQADTRKRQIDGEGLAGAQAKYDEVFEAASLADDQVVAWRKMTAEWQVKRDGALKNLADRGGYYIDEDGAIAIAPGWETQLAGSMPLMDWKRFDAVAKGYFTDAPKAGVKTTYNYGKAANFARRNGVKAKYGAQAINRVVQSIFRPLALLSFRYLARNNFEAQMRSLATVGLAAYDPKTIKAVGLNTAAKGERMYLRGAYGKKNLLKHEAAIRKDLYSPEGTEAMAATLRAERDDLAEFMDGDDLLEYDKYITAFEQRHGLDNIADVDGALSDLAGQSAKSRAKMAKVSKRLSKLDDRKKLRAGSLDVQQGQGKSPGLLGKDAAGINKVKPEVMLGNLSADETFGQVLSLRHSARTRAYKNALGIDNTNVTQAAPNYWDELARHANTTWSGSKLAQMQLDGATPKQILAYFRTAEGKQMQRFAQGMGKNVDSTDDLLELFDAGASQLRAYFPDEAIRRKVVADGVELSADELRGAMGHLRLPDVVGSEIYAIHGLPARGGMMARWSRLTQRGFQALGSVPETSLTRNPYASAIYKKHLADLYQTHGEKFYRANETQMVRLAQRKAVRDLKETQYTVERYSNIAGALEPISPFFQAKVNSLRTWAKLVGDDPAIAARGAQLWGLLDGDRDIDAGAIATADIPVWKQITAATGLDKMNPEAKSTVNPSGLFSTILAPNMAFESFAKDVADGGSFDETTPAQFIAGQVLPDFGGPWVSPMASELRKAWEGDADLNLAQELLLGAAKWGAPFGASNSMLSWETVAPSMMRDAERYITQEKSDSFNIRTAAVLQDMQVDWLKGGAVGPMPTASAATEKVKALYAWDFMAHVTLPFGGYKSGSPNDLIRADIRAQYDAGLDFAQVTHWLSKKYGSDYSPLMGSSKDRFGSVPATMTAVTWLKENTQLVGDYLSDGAGGTVAPETAHLRMQRLTKIIPELHSGKYDPAAASLLATLDVPNMNRQWYDAFDDPGGSLNTKLRSGRGWYSYHQMSAQFKKMQNELNVQFPGEKTGANGKAFFAEYNKLTSARDKVVDQIKADYPDWASEYSMFEDSEPKQRLALGLFQAIEKNTELRDEVTKNNPEYWSTVQDFLEFRHNIQVDLAAAGDTQYRYEQDGAHDRVKAVRERYTWGVNKLKDRNTDFSDMFEDFFEGELFYDDGPRAPMADDWIPRAWTQEEREQRAAWLRSPKPAFSS